VPPKSQGQPIIVKVAPTVTRVEFPRENPVLEYGVPIAGVAFAFAAALFAFLSWRLIQQQIGLAQTQIKQQDETIALNKAEVDLVLEDLRISREQAELANAERAKKPEMLLRVAGQTEIVKIYCVDPEGCDVDLWIYIANEGSRTAQDAWLDLRFSEGFGANRGSRSTDGSVVPFITADRADDGSIVYPFFRTLEGRIGPGTNAYACRATTHLGMGTHSIMWEIGTDDLVFPVGGDIGKVLVAVERPPEAAER
jgi:hypothetical protein